MTISNIYAIVPAKIVRVTFDFLRDIRSVNVYFSDTPLASSFKDEWFTAFVLFAGLIVTAALLKGPFHVFHANDLGSDE